jgi:hypothetical protein
MIQIANPVPFRELQHGMPGVGTIYAIECDGLVKVGFTKAENAERRCRALQTANGRPLRVVAEMRGTMEMEKGLHKVLAPFRVRGEWFRFDAVRFFERLGGAR